MSVDPMANAENIPKEELLHLCMKLNKRMQSVESKAREISKKKQTVQNERNSLLKLLENVIEVPPTSAISTSSGKPNEEDIDITVIEQRWGEWLQKKGTSADVASTASIVDAGQQHNTSIDISIYTNQIKSLEERLSGKHEEIEILQHNYEDLKQVSEEKILYYQLQLQSLKTKDEAALKEAHQEITKLRTVIEEQQLKNSSNQDTVVLLQEKLMELEVQNSEYRAQIKDQEMRASATALLKIEQDSLIGSLRKDMKALLDEREGLLKTNKEQREAISRHESSQQRLALLQEDVLRYQVEVEEKVATIHRMRQEHSKSEDSYAMKTALLASREQEIAQQQQEISARDQTVASLRVQIEAQVIELQTVRESSAKELQEAAASKERELAALNDTQQALLLEMHALSSQHEEAVEQVKRELASKTKMFNNLLAEKDAEIGQLAQKIGRLEEDIQSGHPTERKILEIAMHQSKRDVFNEVSKGSRDIAMQKLQDTIANKDLELAENSQAISQLRKEINELKRSKFFPFANGISSSTSSKNNSMNMDYLKNIVLQYIAFPQQSSEKLSLVSVLAMLLQFTPEELSIALQHTKEPALDSRPAKEITAKRSTSGSSFSSDQFNNNSNNNGSYYSFFSYTSSSNEASPLPSHTNSSHGSIPFSSSSAKQIDSDSNSKKPPIPPNAAVHPSAPNKQLSGRTLSAEESDFQEKLRQITGDILGVTSFDESDSGSHFDYK